MILADERRVGVKSEIWASDLDLNELRHRAVTIQMEFGTIDQADSEEIRVGNLRVDHVTMTVRTSHPKTRTREVRLLVDGTNYSVFNSRPESTHAWTIR